MAQARRRKGTGRRGAPTAGSRKARFRLKIHMRDGRTLTRTFASRREMERAAEELYDRSVRYVEMVRIE